MKAAGNMLVLALISAPFALLSGFGRRIDHNYFIIYHRLKSCIQSNILDSSFRGQFCQESLLMVSISMFHFSPG